LKENVRLEENLKIVVEMSDESNEGRFEKHPDPAGIIIK